MSLSNAASSGTLIQQSAPLSQQKSHLPNPFDLQDSQILDKVYLTHVNDDEKCDQDILFNLVSNVIKGSTQISGTVALMSPSQLAVTSFKPEFSTLKLISCQMITTRGAVHCAHQTTIWILQHLRSFSWDAKALITLAAFALEFGNFWHLYRTPTSDQLGNSLKQLNQVQNRKVPTDIIDLITLLVQVLQYIKEWATWSAQDYDTEEVPALTEALQDVPVVVYWVIAAIVASTGNLVGISDYKLSDFRDRLSPNANKFKEHLRQCKLEIDWIVDSRKRIKDFDKIKDSVDLLKLLIQRKGSLNPLVYDGSTQKNTGIEVFKQKYVLLFISSLHSIGDEILLLNSIYNKLLENPKEVKGFRKVDFKILCIPIVDIWDDVHKEQFKTLKSSIKFYALEYFSELPGIGLIREKLNYDDRYGKPIVTLINPVGAIINENAMDLIFQWGIDAFPFRKEDGDNLTKKWKWLWDLMKKVNDGIEVKEDRYIFIYGGTNHKWIEDFTLAMEKIKRNENIKNVDVLIEHYQLGKKDPNMVPFFWIGIDGKKQNKKHQETMDCEIQDVVKSLLCLKQDPQGWVLLSKGSNIKLLGHGEPMYQTVADFEIWKENVLEKESFDVAFKEYYDSKLKDLSTRQSCAYINLDNYTSNVLATITCPNPTCGRVMEVTSVNYRCCHRDGPNSCSI